MLGVEFPICAFSHCRDVVAAVANAGGFGILGAVAHSPQRLHNELTWIEEQTGGKPYGVDLLLPAKHAASREVQGLLKVLTSPWLLAQLASLPGYDATRCGERPA